ncbi:MAG: aspartate ammonia-lyase [Syntrophales bacterium]
MKKKRIERDLIGELEIPRDVYWGIHTERALRNFPISGSRMNPALIRAMVQVKKACCLANAESGFLERKKAEAILRACRELEEGKLLEQFPLDAMQGGAGTSANMNANEVIANRANEILGGRKGHYNPVDPLADVNLHQSTNDVFPTAVRVAAINRIRDLQQAIAGLQGSFQEREKVFGAIVKIGRTELQEAVPITLGAEFSAFAEALARDRWRTFKCEERLRVVNLGGTAVGTGLAAPREYIFLVIEKLRDVTGLGLARGENLMGETANADPFVEVSGILKAHASNLVKIANDLRLLNFTGEIRIPELQAGSSIMPGKINPVMMEAAIQAGIKAMADDFIITEAASRGTFQINEFLPLLAHALLESLDLLGRINGLLAGHVRMIAAGEENCRRYFDRSTMIITALLPAIGYERALSLLDEFRRVGGDEIRSFLEAKLGKNVVEQALSPYRLTALGFRRHEQDTESK